VVKIMPKSCLNCEMVTSPALGCKHLSAFNLLFRG
jgi:hypothetical protein